MHVHVQSLIQNAQGFPITHLLVDDGVSLTPPSLLMIVSLVPLVMETRLLENRETLRGLPQVSSNLLNNNKINYMHSFSLSLSYLLFILVLLPYHPRPSLPCSTH